MRSQIQILAGSIIIQQTLHFSKLFNFFFVVKIIIFRASMLLHKFCSQSNITIVSKPALKVLKTSICTGLKGTVRAVAQSF